MRLKSDAGKSDIMAILLVSGLIVCGLLVFGALSINWPWQGATIKEEKREIVQVEEAQIFRIEPISLDCRARIRAQVPIEGRKEHKALGQVYRTDKVVMEAIGDVDTCVDANGVEINEGAEGEPTTVIVPASAITFERPRVDAPLTQGSVKYDKGTVGKITDAFPWVEDSEGLTPAAYTFAQSVIGSSECMREAYVVTRQRIIEAYEEQIIEQGGDPDVLVDVVIQGEPDFYQNRDDFDTLNDFEFETADSGIRCEVTDANAGQAAPAEGE